MVSVAVSKLSCSPLFFVEPGVKVDGRYYRDMLLKQQLLPVMRRIAGDTYVFQQDSSLRSRHCSATAAADARVHCSQPVAAKQPRLEPGRLPCMESHAGTSLQDCSAWHSWLQAAPHWDLVEHSADSHLRSNCRVGATTTSLRQSKGTSLRALADAVTNRLFSEPPNATTQQPALVRATHILSKKIAMPPYA